MIKVTGKVSVLLSVHTYRKKYFVWVTIADTKQRRGPVQLDYGNRETWDLPGNGCDNQKQTNQCVSTKSCIHEKNCHRVK